MSFKKIFISSVLSVSVVLGSTAVSLAQDLVHTVQPGDTFWKLSQKYSVGISELMSVNNADQDTILYVGQKLVVPTGISEQKVHTVQPGDTYWIISQKYGVDVQTLLGANNATEQTVLYVGDKVIIPASKQTQEEAVYTVQAGDTYWIISQKYNVDMVKLMEYNGADENTVLYIGQKIRIPQSQSTSTPEPKEPSDPAGPSGREPYITYKSYTVEKGDNFWNISLKFGIPMTELLKVNNMNESTVLNVGDVLRIPVHHVPVQSTPGEKFGEYLDWWTAAQYVIPCGTVFEVVDFYTGKSFMAKRTTGANHADVETLTSNDTAIMKEIWGGSLSWQRRPVIIKYNGRKLAASASSMPHAGNDNAPGGVYTSWRSGDYGAGYNFDWVKNNDMNGVFDIHFPNSTRHSDGQVDEKHQENIKIAAGIN